MPWISRKELASLHSRLAQVLLDSAQQQRDLAALQASENGYFFADPGRPLRETAKLLEASEHTAEAEPS